MTKDEIKNQILNLVKEYYLSSESAKFIAGETTIPASGKLYDSKELILGVEAILDGWWTEGRFAKTFVNELKKYLGVNFISLVNSGSSANLLAFMSLTSPLLGDRRIKPGDEVITVAAGFPTTINPIIQSGAIPVFVDINIGSYNALTSEIEKAITSKTKAIVLAHTLGIPFDLDYIVQICKAHNLWLMEDCCDALGAEYNSKKVGTFGDVATLSFYPAHQITAGEGGAVFTNNAIIAQVMGSIRDWGRSCYCKPGADATCGKRFNQQHGDLPFGYDHKYVYNHIGYNLKMTDMQAAIGLGQLSKIQEFIDLREKHFKELYTFFEGYTDKFHIPIVSPNSKPSYFGFLLTIKEDAGFSRNDIVQYLDERKIGTRVLFSGNATKQPYFIDNNVTYRKASTLKNTDIVMANTFWIGVQPSITPEMLEYVKNTFKDFLADESFEDQMSKNKLSKDNFWNGKKVLVTGHTGFKGTWLTIWLHKLGANVIGYSLKDYPNDKLFNDTKISSKITDVRGDVNDLETLKKTFETYSPEIVFHLAAQPLVRKSFDEPVDTLKTNILGTTYVLDCIRLTDSVKVGVIVTSDKCYKNVEQIHGYKETDMMGGYDPYSCSKGCVELIVDAYRNSFFKKQGKFIGSVRAGNVIGGGDWSQDRLIPDCINALKTNTPIVVRNPKHTRPWQHVLEPLHGYMLLAEKMFKEKKYDEAWNFGPHINSIKPVGEIVDLLVNQWGEGSWMDCSKPDDKHEARLLSLDISKSYFTLDWKPKLNIFETLEYTANWYRKDNGDNAYELCIDQISSYDIL